MTADVLVTIQHARGAQLCARGCRAWFLANNLDWDRFLEEGMRASELRSTGCILCERAIEVAEREAAGE